MQLKNRIFSGLGTGAFIYMIILLSRNKNIITSEAEIISVLIISASAGIFTIIFEKINYLFALLIHFIMMFLVVFSISLYNKWTDNFLSVDFLGGFLLIYLFAWIITLIKTKKEANELNTLLKQIRNF
ncbi:DUF3021 family protein [Lysinibacillus sp. NPDC093190]|uniref:DUF3021 family protein n=1 Tax=Lysinibacillus sp. NPDC093190 TaxID=3390575 RepID=UPI003CFDE79B